jgi:hypothetical protein
VWQTDHVFEDFRHDYSTSDSYGCDFENYLGMDPLAMPDDEPQRTIAPGVSQFDDQVLAENSTSQFCFDLQNIDIHQPLLSPQWSTATPSDKNELDSNRFLNAISSSSSSLELSAAQPPIPLGSGQFSGDPRKSKMKIPSIRMTYPCLTCKESFANEALHRRHSRHNKCTAPSPTFLCEACQRSFTYAKDLTRHRGKGDSPSSCPVLKTKNPSPKRFACTCDKHSYTRKDSLQRHMDKGNARESGQRHRCKICQHFPCHCQT